MYASWTIDELDIYRGLEVPEAWVYERGRFSVHVLGEDGAYRESAKSALLSDLDLAVLASFVERDDQSAAVREYRRILRGGG